MDDLAGLDWSKNTNDQKRAPANYALNPSFSSIKPTPPTSGRATPLLGSATAKPPSKPSTPAPASDSFANLVSWSANPSNTNLSLQEQQKKLAETRAQHSTKQAHQWAGADDATWNNLGSGRSTPAPAQQNGKATATAMVVEDDLFASFGGLQRQPVKAETTKSPPLTQEEQYPDDDDPFGLSDFQQKQIRRQETVSTDAGDDDVLGLLGKPFDPSQRKQHQEEPESRVPETRSNNHPQDRAVAELVDMGFTVDKARQALETTESGLDVQAAVSHLLNSAHQEARERTQSRHQTSNGHLDEVPQRGRVDRRQAGRRRTHVEDDGGPVIQRRQEQSQAEKDPGQMASEFGASFLKTANSLWKQGQKKVQQAVQEFNSDSETGGQPKWMREAESSQHEDGPGRRRRRSSAGKKKQEDATNEAMMLESQRPTPAPRLNPRKADQRFDSSADTSRDHSPAMPSRLRESSSPQPAFLRQQQSKPPQQPSRSTLTRQANEEQAAQAYVSSARRRKPPPPAASASEPDLFDTTSPATQSPRPQSSRPAQPSPKPVPIVTRPPPPTRKIPPIPPLSLKASHNARETGNAHFKRGDYSSAHASYSTSLSHVPKDHPLTLVLLTNHALTALKTGEPKTALTDCDLAIALIGTSKGEAETLDMLDNTPAKPMRDYYGKALMRKAEALEQLEKWDAAASVWREAVEGGHGGATSMQGRLRAEKAAQPKPAAAPIARKKPPPKPKPAVRSSRPAGNSQAVTALRAANAAADKADDERFRLSDSVDAKIAGWKNGKEGNLRALLGSLDTVLWPEANWKKIGMADLVLPARVKVQYMKGIAKVHPDKVSLRDRKSGGNGCANVHDRYRLMLRRSRG